jgi:NAD/NADP transhydrogenase beta subunit
MLLSSGSILAFNGLQKTISMKSFMNKLTNWFKQEWFLVVMLVVIAIIVALFELL